MGPPWHSHSPPPFPAAPHGVPKTKPWHWPPTLSPQPKHEGGLPKKHRVHPQMLEHPDPHSMLVELPVLSPQSGTPQPPLSPQHCGAVNPALWEMM